MIQRNLKGTPEKIAKGAAKIAEESKMVVDKALASSTTAHRVKEANMILNETIKKLDGVAGFADDVNTYKSLVKDTHTLSELNQIKRIADKEYSIYKASSEVKDQLSAESMHRLRKAVRKEIEVQASGEGLGNIRMMNNETAM